MEIKNILVILRRRKWVIIITVLVTMALAILATWMMSPVYTATVTLRIATAAASASGYTDYYFVDRLITTYIKIATSRPLLEELYNQLGVWKDGTQIKVEQIPNSELIQISVDDQNPDLAMKAANALGNILISQGGEFYTGSGKTPANVLKEQVDIADADLRQLRVYYYNHLTRNPNDIEGNQNAASAVSLQQQLYYSLLTQYQELSIQETVQSNILSFVETASLPTRPTKPNKVINIALGLMAGLIGGVSLAFLFENLDTILHTAEEISVITSMHPIGRIPILEKSDQGIPSYDENSLLDEPVSHLRTNLLSMMEVSPLRTFLVTSASQGEGKTILASNLAFSLAQTGKKVILIDCDLRLPSVHKIFDLKNEIGLGDYLVETENLDEIVQGTIFATLHVITSGQIKYKPELLLDSPRMKALLSILLNEYDMILLDTPALLEVTDASVLAPLVDGVILVARPGLIRKEKMEAALEQLDNVKAKVIGLVINGDESSRHYSYYNRKRTPLIRR